jgi:polyisoprenoid-binding protein YceI
MQRAILAVALWLVAASSTLAEIKPVKVNIPAGEFQFDRDHSKVILTLDHLSFSKYIAMFPSASGTLRFDPEAPESMELEATIAAASLETNYPDPALDFNAILTGPEFLDAAQFPDITFKSTKITLTAPDKAAVTGDLTLHGVTRAITLRVTFNGGYAGHPLDPGGARIGFSATGTIYRSDFGIAFGIPEPGTTLGVGDEVAVIIEAEFINPDAPGPQTGP